MSLRSAPSRALSLVVPTLFTLALAGCALKSDVDKLNDRVAKLEEAQKSRPAGPVSATPSASPEDEAAASKLMEDVQNALKTNDYPTAKAKLAEMQSKFATTRAGKAAVRMASEVNVVGTDAHPIEVQKWFTKDQGSYANNKVTLVVFWEAWCPHCKEEMPKLPALLEKYKSKGLGIVALTKVTKTATDDMVTQFITDNKIDFPVGKETDQGTMSQAFQVSGIPAAALVKDGKVIWRGHPARLTDDVMTQLLGS